MTGAVHGPEFCNFFSNNNSNDTNNNDDNNNSNDDSNDNNKKPKRWKIRKRVFLFLFERVLDF